MLKKIVLPMFFTIIIFMLLVFSGNAETRPNQVIIALDPDYETFDPGRAYEMFSQAVTNGLYDNLVKFISGKVEPVNHLVESY